MRGAARRSQGVILPAPESIAGPVRPTTVTEDKPGVERGSRRRAGVGEGLDSGLGSSVGPPLWVGSVVRGPNAHGTALVW